METLPDQDHVIEETGPRGHSTCSDRPFAGVHRAGVAGVAGDAGGDDDEEDDNEKNEKDRHRPSPIEHDLLEARTILVSGPVDDKLCASVCARLLILENRDPKAPITVYINSPGGSADSGFAMYDMMRFVRCPVKTVVNGLCASAAVLVFLGGAEKQRVSLPYSRFLIHQPSTMGRGSASDLRITAEQIVRMRERYNRIVAEATGKSEDEILEASARDFWLSAGEALEFGLIDRIVTHHQDL